MSGLRQLGWPVFRLAATRSAAVSVASEAAWRLDGKELAEIEVGNLLQGLGGGAVAGGVGQRIEPSGIVVLQGDELGDGGLPALPARAAVDGPAVADGGAAGVTGSIARLTLGAGERPIAARLASSWHGCSPLRDAIQGAADRWSGGFAAQARFLK